MQWYEVRSQIICAGMVSVLIAVGCVPHNYARTMQSLQQVYWSPKLVNMQQMPKPKPHEQIKIPAAKTPISQLPDCNKVSCIALTFDDGPNPMTTPQVLTILENEHVPATFFMIGSRVPGNEALLQRMHVGGDEIGNHSWSHPNFTKLTADQIKQQVQQTQDVIVAAGLPAPTLFRPPYGAINQTVRDNVAPLTLAFWNEDPKDWAANTWEQVLAASEASAKPGSVIDMHDIYHVTANALQPLIDNLKSRGFQFVTMSQLMNGQPQDGAYYGSYHP